MSDLPLVSIVTPALNPGARLKSCIGSVAAQTYGRIEHVVIDGGSTDGTIDVLQGTPGLKWISEPDSGQASAINKGFRMAKGAVMGWLNADDVLTPQAVEWVIHEFEKDPRVGWVYGNVEIVRFGRRELARPSDVSKPMSWAARNLAHQPGSFHTDWALKKVGYVDESFHFMMDFDLWLRMLDADVRPAYVRRTLAVFEVHDDSKSGSVSHAEFAFEEGLARLRSGRTRSAAVAFGRAAAWKAFDGDSWDAQRLRRALHEMQERVGDAWATLPLDLVEAGIKTERALFGVKSRGWRPALGLLDREIWRYPETRSRAVHSMQTKAYRLWDHARMRANRVGGS
jgi:glycosyltransferase involved in cell wall biosynthesis